MADSSEIEELFTIHEPADELEKSACRICRLLGLAMAIHHVPSVPLTLEWQTPRHGMKNITGSITSWYEKTKGNIHAGPILTTTLNEPAKVAAGLLQANAPKRIDFTRVRDWIKTCQTSHKRCNAVVQRKLVNLKVIDCVDIAIIPAPENCPFVALSYVWGKPGSTRDPEPGKPLSNLPLTIEDSIKVTQLLGYRYIWIDRYCIDQSSVEDKMVQIAQMGLIYTTAQLTIVAVAGENPSHGLPGVSSDRKSHGAYESIGDLSLVAGPQSFIHEIRQSVWNSRAWTLQEAHFSKKRLCFTDCQVIFICDERAQREIEQDSFRSVFPSMVFLWLNSGTNRVFNAVLSLLIEYSSRQLTYRSDALNAIEGALNTFSTYDPPVSNVWGVPFVSRPSVLTEVSGSNDSNAAMDLEYPWLKSGETIFTVHWYLVNPGSRCTEFPSWSPLGWKGEIFFPSTNDQPIIPRDCMIEVKDGKEYRELHSEPEKTQNIPTASLTQGSQYLRVTAMTIEVNMEYIDWDEVSIDGTGLPKGWYVKCGYAKNAAYDVVFKPYWDSEDTTLREGKSALGVILNTDASRREFSPSPTIILKDFGDKYERIGYFWYSSTRHFNALQDRKTGSYHARGNERNAHLFQNDGKPAFPPDEKIRTFLFG